MSEKTGGPAFPGPAQHEQTVDINEGMTLRDYFAAKAIQTAWRGWLDGYYESDEPNTDIAKCAYQIADAMLKERER